MVYKDEREMLRKSGFAEREVQNLSKLRQHYVEQAKLREVADRRRLEFARWLVTNGRITDQVAS
jgi:hypothetical protein